MSIWYGIDIPMKLADWLKRKNLSHRAFAKRIGRPQPTISRYVSGERIPNTDMMGLIYKATGGAVSANDFYDLVRRT